MPAAAPGAAGGAAVWRVVGGEDRGGILVRGGQELTSAAEALRLGTGALVRELEIAGERLHYRLANGSGPPEGWVSMRTQGKDLLVKALPTDRPSNGSDALRWSPHDGKVYTLEQLVAARRHEYNREEARRHWEQTCIPVGSGMAGSSATTRGIPNGTGKAAAPAAGAGAAAGEPDAAGREAKARAEAQKEKAKKEAEDRARAEAEDKTKREKERREKEEKARRDELARKERDKALREMDEKRSLDLSERLRLQAEERARKDTAGKAAEDNFQRLRVERAQQDREALARRAAREGTKGTCSAEVEARFSSLERLVDEKQAQIKRLSDFCAHLLQEVSDLHQGHSTLHASHSFLCDCLAGSKLLQSEVSNVVLSKQVRQRNRLGTRLSPLCSFVNDGETAVSLWQLLGDQGVAFCRLSQASRPLASLRDTALHLGSQAATAGAGASAPSRPGRAAAAAAAAAAAHLLDDSVWATFKKYEPTPATLEQWEKSQTVQAVLGSMRGIDGLVGKTESVKFSDVHTVFAQIGLPLDHFINKFRYMPTMNASSDSKTLEEATNTILKKFVVQRVEGNDRMACRDLYRMLEIIGYPLQRFKLIFPGAAVVQDSPGDGNLLKIGGYTIRRQIGQGFKGARCYLGEHPGDGTRAAVKWPAPLDEVVTVKEIVKKAPKDCLGIPKLLGSGTFQSKSYLVTELLGSPLANVFQRIHDCTLRQRWLALRIVGRLMVRRLQALHACGFVHCDVSPENILLGRSQGDAGGGARPTLYLIDFELAQKFPGGGKVEGNIGSAEWSSIRSADFVERTPEDDLEALGWVLLNGLIGTLPWFDWLGAAYRDWESKWTRAQTVKQVQRAKRRVLDESPGSAGWRRSVGMPDELVAFLRLCRSMAERHGTVDYAALSALLGGDTSLNDREAEKRDTEQFSNHVVPLL